MFVFISMYFLSDSKCSYSIILKCVKKFGNIWNYCASCLSLRLPLFSIISHQVVIKYVPYVGDSKRALDEYTSEIMMGGKNTISLHNTCEDSLLATPIMLDLIILAEMCQRITFKTGNYSIMCVLM